MLSLLALGLPSLTAVSSAGIVIDFGLLLYGLYACSIAWKIGAKTGWARTKKLMTDLSLMAVFGWFTAVMFTPTMVGVVSAFVGLGSTFMLGRLHAATSQIPDKPFAQWARS